MTTVLDASAILAVLLDEPGQDRVIDAISDGVVSAVNLSEVFAKLLDKGRTGEQALEDMDAFLSMSAPFDLAQALDAGAIRAETRTAGLSLGDRACLALGRRKRARVLTADRGWAALDLGLEIEVIR